jgi:hypothetical protein
MSEPDHSGWDAIVDRALQQGDRGDVRWSQTVAGTPYLTDDHGWLSAPNPLNLGRWR